MPKSYDRREFLGNGLKTGAAFTVLGAAGGLLEACGSSGGPTTQATYNQQKHKTTGKSAAKPKPGGSLTIGVEAEESGFDPTSAHFDSTGVLYARTVYDPLAIVLADGTVAPYLAESITPNQDYTAWTITVRPNVMFHDGTPCDGAALAFCMKANLKSPLVNYTLTYVDSIHQVGPRSIVVKMKKPWIPFAAWLAGYVGGQIAYVFSPTQFAKSGPGGGSLLNTHPVGTGPFVFKEWQPNDHFTATKNPNYWRKDKYGQQLPYLDTITYKPIPDVSSRLSALQSNTIDLMHTDDDPTIVTIRQDSSLQYIEDDVLTIGEPDINFALVNTTLPPVDDIRIRQAMAHAFNAKDYISKIGRNITTQADGPFPSPSEYFAPTNYPKYDPAKATALINAWKHDHGGQAPTILYSTTPTPESQASAALIQTYYQAVGVTMKLSFVQQAEFITDAVLGKFHVFGWRQFANVDPDLNYVFWSSTTVAPSGSIAINFAREKDEVTEMNLEKARQSADKSVRIAAYRAVAERMAIDLPYIWADRDVWNVTSNANTLNWNNPSSPDGKTGLGMLSGIIWPTEIWKKNGV